MATRRISKKKAVTEEVPPVARQVVEEVVEETPAEQPEETLPAEVAEEPVAAEETKEQAVVSELYKPHPAEIPTEVIAESSSSIRSLVVWSLVVIGIALLTGGVLLVAVKGTGGVSIGAKPTPTPTLAPTPTTAPVASRADITVQVLNGGGVAGSGAKMKTLLEEKGYTVGEVKNAEEFTFEETQIHVKADKAGAIDLLKADLGADYTVGTSGADLSSTSSFDAQVIVGKK